MSHRKVLENTEIFSEPKKKNSQFLEKDIIIYRENIYIEEFESLMINGYKEMAKINLELAQVEEEDIASVETYVAWLSGV